jgi:DNA repair protein RadC
MKVYDIKLQFICVREDHAPAAKSPRDVINYLQDAFNERPEQEQVYVVLLNRKGFVKGRHLVSIGTQFNCLLHPTDIFRPAILGGATALIVAHNHPTGDPQPSSVDRNTLRELREAGKILNLPLMDFVIVGDAASDPLGVGYWSAKEAGCV